MVWEDQGLWAAGIVMLIATPLIILIALCCHKSAGNRRILRPNRPFSVNATFFRCCGGGDTEKEIGNRCGVMALSYIIFLKYSAMLFGLCTISSCILVPMFATDDYFNVLAHDSDPQDCRDIELNETECEDPKGQGVFCTWHPFSAPQEYNSTYVRHGMCDVKTRKGLFSLSVQNLSPHEKGRWRAQVFGVAILIYAVIFWFVICKMAAAFKRAVVSHYSGKFNILDSLTVEEAAAVREVGPQKESHVFREGFPVLHPVRRRCDLASRAARTVMITGLKMEEDIKNAPVEGDPLKFLNEFLNVPPPIRSVEPNEAEGDSLTIAAVTDAGEVLRDVEEGNADKAGSNLQYQNKQKLGVNMAKNGWMRGYETRVGKKLEGHPCPFLPSAEFILPKSIALVRKEPKDTLKLIDKEQEALEALKDAVAATKAEKDPSKLPIMTGPPCCKKEAIPKAEADINEVRTELAEKLADVKNQDFTGAVFFTLTEPQYAYRFVEEYNNAMADYGTRAAIAGPVTRVVWGNLPVPAWVATLRWVIMLIAFTCLCFLWGIPVAFLGSLDNLATLPVIGVAFEAFSEALSPTVRGIVQAYLPVIVLVIFNIFLPAIIRLFVFVGGITKGQVMDTSTIVMFFIFQLMSGLVIQAAIQGGLSQLANVIADPNRETIMQMIVSICSPTGGYWFAFMISAASPAALIPLLDLGPLITSKIFVKLAKRQEAYRKIFLPRARDWPITFGVHLFFVAMGMFFYSTIPLLTPFAAIYFLFHYAVQRSLCLDSLAPEPDAIIDLQHCSKIINIYVNLHLVGTIAAVVCTITKMAWGGLACTLIAVIISFVTRFTVQASLENMVNPHSRQIAQWQAHMPIFPPTSKEEEDAGTVLTLEDGGNDGGANGGGDGEAVGANTDDKDEDDRAEDETAATKSQKKKKGGGRGGGAASGEDEEGAVPPGVLDIMGDNTVYFPKYHTYQIDDGAVSRIHAGVYTVDQTWIGELYGQKDKKINDDVED